MAQINGIKTVIQGDSICASACALAFLGGTDYKGNKWMSSTTSSLLGFHAFSRGDGTRYADSDLTQQIVAEILKYGHYVNAPTEIFIRQFSTPSSEMYWFTKQEELDFGIKVWDVDNNLFLPIKERIYSTSILIHQSSISFVRKYFSDIKKVPYRQTWNMLSKRMKRKISLQQYIHWWDKQVQKVTIENITDISSKEIELITENSTIGTVSTLINIKTKKELFRIGGTSKYIKEGEHKGLFITYNRKGYFSAPKYGAFWVDELRDMHGELIEILSKPKDTGVRVSIKSILNTKLPHPLLRQSLDDYVYVER